MDKLDKGQQSGAHGSDSQPCGETVAKCVACKPRFTVSFVLTQVQHEPRALSLAKGIRDLLCAALVSRCGGLIREARRCASRCDRLVDSRPTGSKAGRERCGTDLRAAVDRP